VDGILVIDKPVGFTSHDVVAKVRRILKTKRVGHTGTLDPFATGVLVVLAGRATRLAQFLDKDEKEYSACVRFGFETDTGDATGQVLKAESRMQNEEVAKLLAKTDWESVLVRFRGEIEQIPPMFSAKKVAGKKLYEHARRGVEIERKPIRVNIRSIELIESAIRNPQSAIDTLRIRVACSAGTYIRTLATDIGREINVGAHLTELRRSRAGKFSLSQSVTLDELNESNNPLERLVPIEEAVSHLDAINLNAERSKKTLSGLSTRVGEMNFSMNQPIRMLSESCELLAIGFYNEAEKSVQPKIVLM